MKGSFVDRALQLTVLLCLDGSLKDLCHVKPYSQRIHEEDLVASESTSSPSRGFGNGLMFPVFLAIFKMNSLGNKY